MRFFHLILVAALLVPFGAQAKRAAKKQVKKPEASELMAEARAAFYDYDPGLAMEKIADLRKLKSGYDAKALDALEAKVNRMDEMMQRVEDIVVIDSLTLNRDDFFRHYRLAPAAGTLALPDEYDIDETTVVYIPQDATWMVWGGNNGLMRARRFTDGTWEDPTPLGDVLNHGGTANYPYLLSDGVTIYYATEGEDSLGGLDIYMSRSERDEFAVPQNMGMPYNSPYDDYMLAIDEETGAGWFATDRNRLDDLITIYVFIPSEVRNNLDIDTPDLAGRARISSVAATQPEGKDFSAVLAKIANIKYAGSGHDDEPEFTFVMPTGAVYTRWEQFHKVEARRMMEAYVDALEDFDADRERLAKMRAAYNGRNADAILSLEKKIKSTRTTLRQLANKIIAAEMK